MKLIKEAVSSDHRGALLDKIRQALQEANVKFDWAYGSETVALTGDFEHTTNINDARWLFSDNHYDYSITRINADGTLTIIETE